MSQTIAPIEERATATSAPGSTVRARPDDYTSLVLSALTYTPEELADALRAPIAWIKPGTRHTLVADTMGACPAAELQEVCLVLQEIPTARNLRRARCARIVLCARALAAQGHP
jgi:hypothetical protein